MTQPIEFREIPLFRYFETDARQELPNWFTWKQAKRGEVILSYGKPVPGIFIIASGEVAVSIPNVDSPLALLRSGQCFGEMSLVEEVETASATVTVHSAEVRLMFCAAGDFKKILVNMPGCAYSFYKGAALLLSSRLRQVNSKLNEQLSEFHNLITDVLKDSQVSRQLTETMSEVNETGANVVTKLMQIMPVLNNLHKKFPAAKLDIEQLQKVLEEVFLVDSQNFDRISQQLDLIYQQFENIKRVANGGTAIPLAGDRNLFRKPA
ncbi:Crp/Fnr family transcriptional regulator [Oligoflexus tunisiensis]|uniref:Crp/Fnr family transcriptional regulator n=1 Tax=Oligoflexus tunisiensis TaxID=708132 RepID=UPI00114CC834|nr:cyclic nucleotide-binding domain-containing protein [Oligoflexus tunisiensis]